MAASPIGGYRRHSARIQSTEPAHRAIADLRSAAPTAEGPVTVTRRGCISFSRMRAGSHVFHARQHLLYVGLEAASGVRAKVGDGADREYDAPAGSILWKPSHLEAHLHLSKARESSIVVFTDENLSELAKQQFGVEDINWGAPLSGALDLNVLRIAQLLRDELTNDQANGLLVESLIAILGVHLLHAYASPGVRPDTFKGGLAKPAARKLQSYLQANLGQKVSVGELAAMVNLSPKHFTQAFSRTFGKAPHRYLRDLRLDHAAGLLAQQRLTIAEVAYLSGFSSQSHLTAALQKHRQTTPTRLRSST
ncbi:AraC family transcriptional regulator [Mesorhizobium sp. B2-3-4]|uniref:helix-turn-helix domain-containing protein n=1 Tax=Mesorhizobium sp. B2-3-4 TaxID=2589959 RepID=UPI0015E47BC6|nr:AraC family transcriptional regulator [Mesorhizobium sp. B2-3-4]